jgi:hypothetical protein
MSKQRGPKKVGWGKKWFMRQYWRLQQSQSLISIGFWCTTLTLLIWPYISWRFQSEESVLGISMTYWGLISIAAGVLGTVLAVGWAYDQFFALWKEHQNVIIERNPFATYLLTPRDAMILGHLSSLLRQQNPEDPTIQSQCDWMDEWVSTTPDLEVFRRMVTELDAKLSRPVPEFSFLPDGAVAAARAQARDDPYSGSA